jgi:hypothetical protein
MTFASRSGLGKHERIHGGDNLLAVNSLSIDFILSVAGLVVTVTKSTHLHCVVRFNGHFSYQPAPT